MNNTYWIFGAELEIICCEDQTASKYDLVKGTFQPGIEVPLHIHSKYAESVYVEEGELTVFTPGKSTVLKKGKYIFIPVGTPHALLSTGEKPAVALTVAAPSGLARIIRIAGLQGLEDDLTGIKQNDMELFMKTSAEEGDELLGPPGTRP
jgi:quercetin dioxygenase-like cupin family protein